MRHYLKNQSQNGTKTKHGALLETGALQLGHAVVKERRQGTEALLLAPGASVSSSVKGTLITSLPVSLTRLCEDIFANGNWKTGVWAESLCTPVPDSCLSLPIRKIEWISLHPQ